MLKSDNCIDGAVDEWCGRGMFTTEFWGSGCGVGALVVIQLHKIRLFGLLFRAGFYCFFYHAAFSKRWDLSDAFHFYEF